MEQGDSFQRSQIGRSGPYGQEADQKETEESGQGRSRHDLFRKEQGKYREQESQHVAANSRGENGTCRTCRKRRAEEPSSVESAGTDHAFRQQKNRERTCQDGESAEQEKRRIQEQRQKIDPDFFQH